jgi:hypothetical protein
LATKIYKRPAGGLRSLKRALKPNNGETIMQGEASKRGGWSWWYLLFVVQFVVILWPPFYNSIEPRLWGIPFFYWFQLLWVLVSAVLTAIVYFATAE